MKIVRIVCNRNFPYEIAMFRSLALVVLAFILSADARADRPNIVLILADDLGYGSLGCYGSATNRTPEIDRLAREGMRFTDFHSNGPFCTPTRAALMTGRYQQRCEWVADEKLSPAFAAQRRANMKQRFAWGISLEETTIADLLRTAGYRTALIGRWHLGYDFDFHPMNQGFDLFRGFVSGGVDYHTHIARHGLQQLDWWRQKEIRNEPGYSTDLLTDYAVEFIERYRTEPFFLYVAHGAPHLPLQVRDPNTKKPRIAVYHEMIETLDESVGRIRGALQTAGLEKNTLLIFCSDNGATRNPDPAANRPLRGGKGSMYEGGHRVPCIAVMPDRIPADVVCRQTVMTMDFFPTFASLAGVDVPASVAIDGVDLTPLFMGKKPPAARTLHWEMAGAWVVRQGNWKLIGEGQDPKELFNLAEDIGEGDNKITDQPELVQSLTESHRLWSRAVKVEIPEK